MPSAEGLEADAENQKQNGGGIDKNHSPVSVMTIQQTPIQVQQTAIRTTV